MSMGLRCNLLESCISSLDKSVFQNFWTSDRGLCFCKLCKHDGSLGVVFVSSCGVSYWLCRSIFY